MITLSRTAELTRLCRTENISGTAFTNESGGHKWTIACTRNGVAEALTGSVNARFIRADNTSVALTAAESYAGIDTDGNAWVTLAANCYTVAGPFGLIVYHTDTDNNVTAIYSCAGYIRTGETSAIVDPENVINLEAIVARIDAMDAAVTACNTATTNATNALDYIADTYSASATYAVGDYAVYSGALYRCTTAITTAEAWTSGHWTAVTFADEVSQLSDEIDTKITEPTNEGTAGQALVTDGNGGRSWATVEIDVDATLTQTGEAADAKVTGDAIGELFDESAQISRIASYASLATGVDILSSVGYENGYISASGSITSQGETTKEITYNYIPVKSGQTIRADASMAGDFWIAFGYWTSGKSFISRTTSTSSATSGNYKVGTLSSQVPNNAAYVRLSLRTYDDYTATLAYDDNYADRIAATETGIDSVSAHIINANGGKETLDLYGNFVNGNLYNGANATSFLYHVSSTTIFDFDRDLTLTIADGFRANFHIFSGTTFVAASGWKTGTITILKNTEFKVAISRTPEDTSELADVSLFVSKLVAETQINTDDLNSIIIGTQASVSITEISGLNLAKNGTAYSSSSAHYTKYIPVAANQTYVFDVTNNTSGTVWVRFGFSSAIPAVSVSAEYLSESEISSRLTDVVKIVPTSSGYLSVSTPGQLPVSAVAYLNGLDKRLADIAATASQASTFSDKINTLKTITYYDFDTYSGYIDASGNVHSPVSGQDEIYTENIPVANGKTYRIDIAWNSEHSGSFVAYALYQRDGTFIERITLSWSQTISEFGEDVTINSASAAYMIVFMRTYSDVSTFSIYQENAVLNIEKAVYGLVDSNDPQVWRITPNLKAVNHRGYSTVAPENTLPAYVLSKKMGFDIAECDIVFTQDAVPVLLHDTTINRTARNADGTSIADTVNISAITYNEALEYDFGIWKGETYSGTVIPTFTQFITLCRNIGLHPYIELKDISTYTEARVQGLVDIVEACGMKGKVTWISFSATLLGYIKAYDSKARLGYLLNTVDSTGITTALSLQTSSNEVFIDTSVTTDEAVALCKANGIPMEVWTINNLSTLKALNPYITGVTSDSLNVAKVMYNENVV